MKPYFRETKIKLTKEEKIEVKKSKAEECRHDIVYDKPVLGVFDIQTCFCCEQELVLIEDCDI